MLWFLIWLPLLGPKNVWAGSCYACSGVCKTEPCNCQMGSCESNYCFTEKKTDPSGILRITKGCIKNPARRMGCDYDRNKDSIVCVCNGDFCNDIIQMMPQMRRNITCRKCDERDPKCSDTCVGQWCYESSTGQAGCRFGPPSLPFFYETSELLMSRTKVCATLSRGNGIPIRHCICNVILCNDHAHNQAPFSMIYSPHRSRSVSHYNTDNKPLKISKCISCDVSTQDSSVTTACRQNSCMGHFCTYTSQRYIFTSFGQRSAAQAVIHEKQGCVNVTDPRNVKYGCVHKWTNNEEEISCICPGDDHNIDINTCAASLSIKAFMNFKLITCCLFLLLQFTITSRH
ncbi:hypothetical protein M3Y97_00088900 [Aphelenchoides bicaudatus]|nr:hypothetical protein M3Y97_00088900 [Aphelenchoides bicaudatus]